MFASSMRRSLAIAPLVVGLLSLPVTPASARDRAPTPTALKPVPASSLSVRADTLFLFAASGPGSFGSPGTVARGFSFDAADGSPDPAGWTGVDASVLDQNVHWHVTETAVTAGHDTDMSGAAPFDPGDTANDYSFWCGELDQCNWVHPSGYGLNWIQSAVIDLEGAPVGSALQLDFGMSTWFEGDVYDYLEVIARWRGGGEQLIATYNDYLASPYAPYTLTLPAAQADGDSLDAVIFRFTSDGSFADQDGQFPTDIGAVWLDNIVVTVDGAERFAADFEDGQLPAAMSLVAGAPGAGDFATLRHGLNTQDSCVNNGSYYWTFFDPSLPEPGWPDGVVPYGPPFMWNYVRSPVLSRDQYGQPLNLDASSRLIVSADVYLDLPLEQVVFFQAAISAGSGEDPNCYVRTADNNLYFGEETQWRHYALDFTYTLHQIMGDGVGDTGGIVVDIGVVDACPFFCNIYGDGQHHHGTPYIDNITVAILDGGPAAFDVLPAGRFQDAFDVDGDGTVRIDSARDLVQLNNTMSHVAGDSLGFTLGLDAHGGVAQTFNGLAGEPRPELRLFWRVVDGPHAGSTDPTMADPDAADGIWSPWAGVMTLDDGPWCTMQAELVWDRPFLPDYYAFDFNDAYFLPGDRIEYFLRGLAVDGKEALAPGDARAADPAARAYFHVSCLPTAGHNLLLVDKGGDLLDAWELAFAANGLSAQVDRFTANAPGGEYLNSLGTQASLASLSGYRAILWDNGSTGANTLITGLGPRDRADEGQLLQDWLAASTVDAGLWIMGDHVAEDIDDGSPYLAELLGAELHGGSYQQQTGILTPSVLASHPLLAYLGGTPDFIADGGCPDLREFSGIRAVVDPLVETAFTWADDGGSGTVAGTYALDPEGDGDSTNAGGHATRALLTPFGYATLRDTGYGNVDPDYVRQLPLMVLSRLMGYPGDVTGTSDPAPSVTGLARAYPNPFNPSTTLRYSLAAPQRARLSVHDILGRELAVLVDGLQPAGPQEVVWDGRDGAGRPQASGIYFAEFRAGVSRERQKLVLLK